MAKNFSYVHVECMNDSGMHIVIAIPAHHVPNLLRSRVVYLNSAHTGEMFYWSPFFPHELLSGIPDSFVAKAN